VRRSVCLLFCLVGTSILVPSCDTEQPNGPTCVYALSDTAFSFPAPGGTGSIDVATASGCAWSASAGAGWLQISSGANGSGPGTVAFTVAANSAVSPRTASLTIANQAVSVSQEGAPACTFGLSSGSATFDETGGVGAVSVTAGAGCAWTAHSSVSWVVITSGTSGTGNGSVAYTVSRNSDTAGRTAGLTVADQSFVVTQTGDVERCQYSVTPVAFSPCMASRQLTSSIATDAGCPWTATAGVPWITVTTGASGTGDGQVSVVVSDNWDVPRHGIVMIRWPAPTAGQNLQIQQAGCYYAVSQSSFTYGSSGGSGSFDVLQQSDPVNCGGPLQNACRWSAQSTVAWIAVTTSMPRAGDDRVSFTVAPNDSTQARSGQITVRDQAVLVMQAGR